MPTEQLETEHDDQHTPTRPPLAGKTCVVTGGSRGIGQAIAETLADNGATVVINYRSGEANAREIADSIEADDGSVMTQQADVCDPDEVTAMAEAVAAEFGSVDVLINNAGITIDKRFDQLTPEDWERVIDVNLNGPFHCTKAFYEDIKAAPEGRVINISSVVGHRGSYGQTNYAASKSGLFGFTRSLALELAPYGSTANCVAPGYTHTEMVDSVREDIQDTIREQIPLRRFASVDEIANVVRFLASDDASYVTGEVINVNGGLYG